MARAAASVVIPTKGRPAALCRSLKAVMDAAEGSDRDCEIIVVDDGPDPSTEAVVDSMRESPSARLRYVSAAAHGAQGPGEARNVGVALAESPVMVFTDDDTRCRSDWLAVGLGRLEAEPALAGVEGIVVPQLGGQIAWARARVVRNEAGGDYLTANLFMRRAAISKVGGFRSLPFREDTDLGLRVREQVGPIAFDAACVVYHPVDEVPLRAHLRTAWYFTLDEAFFAAHPRAAPRLLSDPVSRIRIRLACLSLPGIAALALPAWRRSASGALSGIATLISVQVELDLRQAGIRRSSGAVARSTAARLPRSLAWAVVAGVARTWGFLLVRLMAHELPPPSLTRFETKP